MRGRFRSLWVVIAALAVVTGCSNDEPSPDVEAAAVRAQMAWDSAQQQYEEVREIEERLVRGCLTKQGFDVFPEVGPAPKKSGDRLRPISGDLDEASRIGYGLDPRRVPAVDASVDTSAYAKSPDSYKQALTLAEYGPISERISYTTPDGTIIDTPGAGCTSDIRKKLYGDLKEYLRLSFTAVNLIRIDTSRDMEGNPKVSAAIGTWKTCVNDAGYPSVSSPRDMRDKALELYSALKEPDDKLLDITVATEIKIATTDAQCAKSSGLNEAIAAARAEGSVNSLAKYEADLVAWNTMVRKALETAQEMLKHDG